MMDYWRFLYWWILPALVIPLILPWWRSRRGGAAFGAYELASMVLRPSAWDRCCIVCCSPRPWCW